MAVMIKMIMVMAVVLLSAHIHWALQNMISDPQNNAPLAKRAAHTSEWVGYLRPCI